MTGENTAMPYRVLSSQQMRDFLQRLEACQQELYESNSKKSVGELLEKHLLQEELRVLQVSSDHQLCSKQLEKLKKEMLAWPRLEVYLAFEPDQEFMQYLVRWFGNHSMWPARLIIRYRPEILGGLMVKYQGQSYDLSLASDLAAINERLPKITI